MAAPIYFPTQTLAERRLQRLAAQNQATRQAFIGPPVPEGFKFQAPDSLLDKAISLSPVAQVAKGLGQQVYRTLRQPGDVGTREGAQANTRYWRGFQEPATYAEGLGRTLGFGGPFQTTTSMNAQLDQPIKTPMDVVNRAMTLGGAIPPILPQARLAVPGAKAAALAAREAAPAVKEAAVRAATSDRLLGVAETAHAQGRIYSDFYSLPYSRKIAERIRAEMEASLADTKTFESIPKNRQQEILRNLAVLRDELGKPDNPYQYPVQSELSGRTNQQVWDEIAKITEQRVSNVTSTGRPQSSSGSYFAEKRAPISLDTLAATDASIVRIRQAIQTAREAKAPATDLENTLGGFLATRDAHIESLLGSDGAARYKELIGQISEERAVLKTGTGGMKAPNFGTPERAEYDNLRRQATEAGKTLPMNAAKFRQKQLAKMRGLQAELDDFNKVLYPAKAGTTPPEMAAGAQAQAGLGIGEKPQNATMFGEFSGKTAPAESVPLIDREALLAKEANKPLPGQTDFLPHEYKGGHRPVTVGGGAARLDDLVPAFGEDIYGPNGAKYFGTGDNQLDAQTLNILKSVRGKPNAELTVYRAVPKDVTLGGLNVGDWVTVNRTYAVSHGKSILNGDYKIIEQRVKASDLTTNADSFHEQGYYPDISSSVAQKTEKRSVQKPKIPSRAAQEAVQQPLPPALTVEEKARYAKSNISSSVAKNAEKRSVIGQAEATISPTAAAEKPFPPSKPPQPSVASGAPPLEPPKTSPVATGAVPPEKPPIPPSGGIQPAGSGDPVKKLIGLIKAAKPARTQTEALKSQELGKRAAIFGGRLEKAQGFEELTGAKPPSGELPKAAFDAPFQGMTTPEWDILAHQINDYKPWANLSFTRGNALSALKAVSQGQIPTIGDIALLEEVFGRDFSAALLSKLPLSEKILTEILEAVNLPRALVTNFDLSAALRQGSWFSTSRPKAFADAFRVQIRALRSEAMAKAELDSIRSSAHAALYDQAKLAITAVDAAGTRGEELFIRSLADRIPGLKTLVRPGERAYVMMLNKLRANVFDEIYNGWVRDGRIITDQDITELGRYVNVATGRGTLPKLGRKTSMVVNSLFYSTRFVISKPEIARMLVSPSAAVRREAWMDFLRYAGPRLTVAATLTAGGVASFELDPRSPDFGKFHVGNVRVDPWGGWQPLVRYAAQAFSNERKTLDVGDITPIAPTHGEGAILTAGRFARSKLAPVPSVLADIAFGMKKFTGEGATFLNEAKSLTEPMILQDILDAGQQAGWIAAGPLGALSALGAGVQTFDAREKPWQESFSTGVKAYLAIPSNDITARKEARTTRDIYRMTHPDVDAELFIIGETTSLTTPAAHAAAVRLMKQKGIGVADIKSLEVKKDESPSRTALRKFFEITLAATPAAPTPTPIPTGRTLADRRAARTPVAVGAP